MKKFNFKDFEIDPEMETGNDDQVYGNYVDWDEFRENNEDELLQYFDIYLPWDEDIDLEHYIKFITQPLMKEFKGLLTERAFDTLKYKADEVRFINDIVIKFPTKEPSIVDEIFDFCGVPSGTDYEYDLPEELQFWPAVLGHDDDDYLYFQNSTFSLDNHKEMLEEIEGKINEIDDELIQKSLLLTTMIFSEILLKSLITKKIPNSDTLDDINNKILNKSINKKLRGGIDDIRGFFNEVYGEKAPKLKWAPLRNLLTHEFNNCTINDNNVYYTDQKTQQTEYWNMELIIQQQKTFNSELSKKINKKSY